MAPPAGRTASVLLGEEVTEQIIDDSMPKSKWLLDPTSPRLLRWQLFVAVLLIFTAIVTPFEVGFLESRHGDMLQSG